MIHVDCDLFYLQLDLYSIRLNPVKCLRPLGLHLQDGVKRDRVLLQQLVPVVRADHALQVAADVRGGVLQQDGGGDPMRDRQVGDGVG